MRIIIELDNVAPVTLKVSPTESEQSTAMARSEALAEAMDAGAAPNADSPPGSPEGAMEATTTAVDEDSAGPAPSI